jgi:hypothetical protein
VNPVYVAARMVRRFLPLSVMHFMMRHRILVKPGMESYAPKAAVERYVKAMDASGISLAGKRVMDFGYGGYFGTGVELLRRGAAHVVLCDPYATIDEAGNAALLEEYGEYLIKKNGKTLPDPKFMTVLAKNIFEISSGEVKRMDIILSTSVLEHLDDVQGITRALAKLTDAEGVNFHFVDLRDHFFKYPFEMLTFSERIWHRWLNPPSNLNRYRLSDYERIFPQIFGKVEIEIVNWDEAQFEKSRSRIKPEFLTGDTNKDSAIRIKVLAAEPVCQ